MATVVLRPGGSFVAKIFTTGPHDTPLLVSQLSLFFTRVAVSKPKSSRPQSKEHFIVCMDYSPPPGFVADLNGLGGTSVAEASDRAFADRNVPYLRQGDLSGFEK
jgi:hypothetical protein